MKQTILLIDAHSLIHRCFHALPPLTAPSGEPIQAIYGLAMMLLRITNSEARQRPAFVVAFFDRPEPTFRKELFKEYKAHRPKASDELVSQIHEAYRLFEAFGIPVVEKAGYEADDLIGTVAEQHKNDADTIVRILSSDNDFLQLVDDGRVIVESLKKGIRETILYDEGAVYERFGVHPNQLADYKGLVGDASDNIPGVPGIGPKRAVELLHRYKTLDALYENVDSDPVLAKKIGEWKDQALLSRRLAVIERNLPVSISLVSARFAPSTSLIAAYFTSLGFTALLNRIKKQQTLL